MGSILIFVRSRINKSTGNREIMSISDSVEESKVFFKTQNLAEVEPFRINSLEKGPARDKEALEMIRLIKGEEDVST